MAKFLPAHHHKWSPSETSRLARELPGFAFRCRSLYGILAAAHRRTIPRFPSPLDGCCPPRFLPYSGIACCSGPDGWAVNNLVRRAPADMPPTTHATLPAVRRQEPCIPLAHLICNLPLTLAANQRRSKNAIGWSIWHAIRWCDQRKNWRCGC